MDDTGSPGTLPSGDGQYPIADGGDLDGDGLLNLVRSSGHGPGRPTRLSGLLKITPDERAA